MNEQQQQQQQLLNVIRSDEQSESISHSFDTRGIDTYRRNLLANAQRALEISFPTVFQLIDSDISADLVKLFLQLSPPTQGDWSQWGSVFSDFIGTTEVGRNYPYLADCAALDWHMHRALHGEDQTLEHASLQLLADYEPECILIVFNNNVQLLHTCYPVKEIFDAHHHEDEAQRSHALHCAKQILMQAPVDHLIMVYRPEFQPKVVRLSASESVFMLALMTGNTLAQSLNAVSQHEDFSFEKWLVMAIKFNLIHHLKES